MAKKSKLSNGLRVVTHTVKGVESVFVGVGVHTGNRSESDKEIGLSHALEHMLFKGTTNRTGPELVEAPDFVGSYANAFTSNEQTVYYLKGLRENIELSMDILSDQVFNSNFPAAEQKKEMEVIEQEIKRSFDDPNNMVYQNFISVAFKGNRLATPILGSAEQVLAYTPQDMAAYYGKNYAPKNMVLSVAGNVKHKDIVALAEKYFGKYINPFKKTKTKTPTWNPGQLLHHKPEDSQVTALVGWPMFGRDDSTLHQRVTAQVLNTILSTGMSSKLFKEIREKRGLVYSVGSFMEDFSDVGFFAIVGGTDELKLPEFLSTTAMVLKNFNTELTLRDIVKAKNALKAQLAMSMEKIDTVALANINSMQNYKRPYDVSVVLEEIDTVTAEDVTALLKQIISNKPVLSVYGNYNISDDLSVEKFEKDLNG